MHSVAAGAAVAAGGGVAGMMSTGAGVNRGGDGGCGSIGGEVGSVGGGGGGGGSSVRDGNNGGELSD